MKHILNEMSDEERNSIRSQHTGTLSVQTGKFKKLVENKLGNVKPLISEQYESFTAFDEQEDEDKPNDKSKFRRHVEKHWSSHYPDLSDSEREDFITNLDDSPEIHSHFNQFDDEEFNEDMIDDVDYGGEEDDEFEDGGASKVEYVINKIDGVDELIQLLGGEDSAERILRRYKPLGLESLDDLIEYKGGYPEEEDYDRN